MEDFNFMKKEDQISNIVKIVEGIVLVALGIVFLCFFQSADFGNAIGYCIGTVVLIFGLVSILFAFLLGKGILNTSIITGSFMVALGVLLFVNPDIVTNYVALLFSVILIVYSLSIITECIFAFMGKPKRTVRGIIFAIIAALLLGFGITILICYFNNADFAREFTLVIVGICFLTGGVLLVVTSSREMIIANKANAPKKPAKKIKKDVVAEEKDDKNLPIDEKPEEIKGIEDKKDDDKHSIDEPSEAVDDKK